MMESSRVARARTAERSGCTLSTWAAGPLGAKAMFTMSVAPAFADKSDSIDVHFFVNTSTWTLHTWDYLVYFNTTIFEATPTVLWDSDYHFQQPSLTFSSTADPDIRVVNVVSNGPSASSPAPTNNAMQDATAAPDAAQDAAPDAQDAATRQNLEARYVGLTFIDDDAAGEGAREIVRIEKAGSQWTAVAAQLTNRENEQPYLVNEALDAMVDAYRCRGDARHETCACPPPRGHTIEVLWEVHDEETNESRDVWWRAVVGEEDGTGHALDNGDVVLRKYSVEYVARPELSEPAPAAYDVCFLSPRALLDCAGDVVMQWRSFGSSDLCGNQPVR